VEDDHHNVETIDRGDDADADDYESYITIIYTLRNLFIVGDQDRAKWR
jgi:hypothetical protein